MFFFFLFSHFLKTMTLASNMEMNKPSHIQTDHYTFPSRSKSSSSLNQVVSPTYSFVSSKSTNCLDQCIHKTDSVSTSSSSYQHQRRFHSSHLGKPPSLKTARQPSIKLPILTATKSQKLPKIAPMKEVEKVYIL